MPTSREPTRAFRTACSATLVLPSVGAGSLGTCVLGGLRKASAPVKSPTARRRQADRLGTGTPKRFSISRSTDVWSSTPEYLYPPRLNGEITSAGVRKPSPTGPVVPPAAEGSGEAGRYSPPRPAGAAG